MARFIVSHRRAGKFARSEKQASRGRLDTAFATHLEPGAQVVGDNAPADDTARRVIVFDADPHEVAAKTPHLGDDVLLEPEIPHRFGPPLLATAAATPFAAAATPLGPEAAGNGAGLTLALSGDDGATAGGQALLYLRALPGAPRAASVTLPIPDSGEIAFGFHPGWIPTALVVSPGGRYWAALVRGPEPHHRIRLRELPADGPLGWWHRALGVRRYDPDRGRGIRIGVLDTGCGPHGYLEHVTVVGAFLNGGFDPAGGADVEEHGTHVCGILGARPATEGQRRRRRRYAGITPGAEIFCGRVFAGGGADATQADIVNGIDHLSRTLQADLINLSLSAVQPSDIERDAIVDAMERGTLCICSAGNTAGAIQYPAAFPEAVAVSALGKEGWAPEGTLSATRYPHDTECYGDDGLFLASFSCFGEGIACCAPGVGIVSTLPNRTAGRPESDAYGAMDGTSMAAPAACGALAALLARDRVYQSLPRDLRRTLHARQTLRRCCRDIQLKDGFGGRGIPWVGGR